MDEAYCMDDPRFDPLDDWPDIEENYCHFCGKHYEDFSDLGCEHCDVRATIS